MNATPATIRATTIAAAADDDDSFLTTNVTYEVTKKDMSPPAVAGEIVVGAETNSIKIKYEPSASASPESSPPPPAIGSRSDNYEARANEIANSSAYMQQTDEDLNESNNL